MFSDWFDSVAKTNFSLARRNSCYCNVNKKFFQTSKFSRPRLSQNRRQSFGIGVAKKIVLYSNHTETILKYFVPNLINHKNTEYERASRLLMPALEWLLHNLTNIK